MSWQDYSLARQYLLEFRIGTRVRESKHAEDAHAKRSQAAIQRSR